MKIRVLLSLVVAMTACTTGPYGQRRIDGPTVAVLAIDAVGLSAEAYCFADCPTGGKIALGAVDAVAAVAAFGLLRAIQHGLAN